MAVGWERAAQCPCTFHQRLPMLPPHNHDPRYFVSTQQLGLVSDPFAASPSRSNPTSSPTSHSLTHARSPSPRSKLTPRVPSTYTPPTPLIHPTFFLPQLQSKALVSSMSIFPTTTTRPRKERERGTCNPPPSPFFLSYLPSQLPTYLPILPLPFPSSHVHVHLSTSPPPQPFSPADYTTHALDVTRGRSSSTISTPT